MNADDAGAVASAREATRIVAHTFTEFLYRYWIENTIGFKRSNGIDSSAAEATYVESV